MEDEGEYNLKRECQHFLLRTGQMFSCSSAVLWRFCRMHFLFAGQDLFSGQILAFDSLPPVKKLGLQKFCRTDFSFADSRTEFLSTGQKSVHRTGFGV